MTETVQTQNLITGSDIDKAFDMLDAGATVAETVEADRKSVV